MNLTRKINNEKVMKSKNTPQNMDTPACRAYWTEQMEQAYDFMQKMLAYPVEECGEKMISLRQAVKKARLTVIFSDSKIAGKFERAYYLREGLIKNFLAAAKELNNRGWFIKVEDAYRTRKMQQYIGLQDFIFDFILQKVIWENDGKVPSPELMYRRFSAFVATCPKVGTHMSGSALDISVCNAGSLCELNRGADYLEMSEITFMDSPFISPKAQKNRREIKEVMEKHSFMAYPYEFWHFSSGDAYSEYLLDTGKPARYGAISFSPSSGDISTVENPEVPLHSMDNIQDKIDAAVKRLKLNL